MSSDPDSGGADGSDGDDSGPGAREVAYRVFAAEFDDADLDHSESDEERAPNYVVTPTGLRVNRLFAVGVLTEVEEVNEGTLRGRVVDPTGAFVTYAGQYQPDAVAFLDRTTPPAFVAITGKARTFQPEDSERVYTSVRPESLSTVDAGTRDRWTVSAARATLRRIAVFAAAMEMDERGDDLRARLEAAGVPTALAAGIPLALDHYGTTESYLEAVRSLAVDALEVVAGDLDEVRSLDAAPDETGRASLGALPPVEYDFDVPAPTAAPGAGEEATMADVDPDAEAPDPTDEGPTGDSGLGEPTTEAEPVTADGGDGTDDPDETDEAVEAGAEAPTDDEETGDVAETGGTTVDDGRAVTDETGTAPDDEETEAVPDSSVSAPDPDGRAEVDTAEEASADGPGADADDLGEFEDADAGTGTDGTADAGDTGDTGGLGEFEDADAGTGATPDEVDDTPRGETDPAGPGDFEEPDPGEGSPNDFGEVGPNDPDDDADPGDLEEANATEFDAPDADPEATPDTDPADPDPDDFEDALSDEERQQAEAEHGIEFSSGTDVPEPGDAGIETPDPEAGMSEGMDEEIADQHQPEPTPGAGATEPATEDEVGTKPAGEEAAPTEGEGAEPAAVEDPAEAATVDDPDASTPAADPADEATMEPGAGADAADVDLEDAVVDIMGELDDGDGADRIEVVAAAVDRYGVDDDVADDAIQDALMGGKCYEPDDDVLKPI